MIKNYYQLLDLPKNATQTEIKKAFRVHAIKYHPDKQGGDKFFEEKFKEIKEAYDVLSQPELRKTYDKKLFGFATYKGMTEQTASGNSTKRASNFYKKKEENYKTKEEKRETPPETPEQKEQRKVVEKRTKDIFIGIGTVFMVFFLFSIFGERGIHVPVAMFFVFWTIRQIFVVLISFLSD